MQHFPLFRLMIFEFWIVRAKILSWCFWCNGFLANHSTAQLTLLLNIGVCRSLGQMSSFIISNLGADLGNGLRRSGNHANMSERPTDRSCEALSPGHRPI